MVYGQHPFNPHPAYRKHKCNVLIWRQCGGKKDPLKCHQAEYAGDCRKLKASMIS